MIHFIQCFHSLLRCILPCVGIAVHCDAGLAVSHDGRGDVCVVGRFVDVSDDSVPEGVACIVYFMTDTIKILMFIWLSVLNLDILRQTLLIFPVAMLGLWLGMKSSKIMNETIAKKIVLVMLIISGLALTINNL